MIHNWQILYMVGMHVKILSFDHLQHLGRMVPSMRESTALFSQGFDMDEEVIYHWRFDLSGGNSTSQLFTVKMMNRGPIQTHPYDPICLYSIKIYQDHLFGSHLL